jgi:hypothetical protein
MRHLHLILIFICLCACNQEHNKEYKYSNCILDSYGDTNGVYAHWDKYGIGFNESIDGKHIKLYKDSRVYMDSIIFLNGAIGTSIMIPKKELPFFYLEIENNKCVIKPNITYSCINIGYDDSLKTTYVNFRNSPITEW